MYSGHCKILMKESKDNVNRWRDTPCSWVGRINIIKMTVLPNAIYRFNAIPIKLPMALFHKIRTKKITICMATQKTTDTPSNSEKEKWSLGMRLPDFRVYYKAIFLKKL